MAYALAMPMLPAASWQRCWDRAGPTGTTCSAEGVTRESYFMQHVPDGNLFIVTGEGIFSPISEWLDPEGIPFDRWFAEQMHEVTGADVRELGGDPPEHLGDWHP